MIDDLILKKADIIKEIGYVNKLAELGNDKNIYNGFFTDRRAVVTINELMQEYRMKTLLENPAKTIKRITRVIYNLDQRIATSYGAKLIKNEDFKYKNNIPIISKIITLHEDKYIKIIPIYNILLQELVNLLLLGTKFNLNKYSYMLDKEFIITTLKHDTYTAKIDVKIPRTKKTDSALEIANLIQTLGIENTVYLLGILLHFSYYKAA